MSSSVNTSTPPPICLNKQQNGQPPSQLKIPVSYDVNAKTWTARMTTPSTKRTFTWKNADFDQLETTVIQSVRDILRTQDLLAEEVDSLFQTIETGTSHSFVTGSSNLKVFHLNEDDQLCALEVPVYYDAEKELWIAMMQTPTSNRLIVSDARTEHDLSIAFHNQIQEILRKNDALSSEIRSLFQPI